MSVYEKAISAVENSKQAVDMENKEIATEDDQPKVIMPSELKTQVKKNDIHSILQESRISKDQDEAIEKAEKN